MIPEILKGPLRFGDPQQIHALRELNRKADYDALPKCKECNGSGKGDGDCPEYDGSWKITGDCGHCDGEGKDFDAMEAHRKKYPL